MAVNLRETISRLQSKTEVLFEKYNILAEEKKRVDEQNATLQTEIELLKKELTRANTNLEYMKIARNISHSSEELANSKAILVQFVRDVDNSIPQPTHPPYDTRSDLHHHYTPRTPTCSCTHTQTPGSGLSSSSC